MRRHKPNHRDMVENLTLAFRNTTPADRIKGMGWYAEAQRFAETLATVANMPTRNIAGAIAATSPAQTWEIQQVYLPELVRDYLNGTPAHKSTGIGTVEQKRKAYACLDGVLGALGNGKKTNRFLANLLGNTTVVTIDRWAYRVAVNDLSVMQPSPDWYEAIEAAYQEAAWQLGYTPREFQAILWVYIRRITSRKDILNARKAR
jgi:hypothetical protein